MATTGGNLLQRVMRCNYFYDPDLRGVHKRTPGPGCFLMEVAQSHARDSRRERAVHRNLSRRYGRGIIGAPNGHCAARSTGSTFAAGLTVSIACPADTPHVENENAAGRVDHRRGTSVYGVREAGILLKGSRDRNSYALPVGPGGGAARYRRRQPDPAGAHRPGGVAPNHGGLSAREVRCATRSYRRNLSGMLRHWRPATRAASVTMRSRWNWLRRAVMRVGAVVNQPV